MERHPTLDTVFPKHDRAVRGSPQLWDLQAQPRVLELFALVAACTTNSENLDASISELGQQRLCLTACKHTHRHGSYTGYKRDVRHHISPNLNINTFELDKYDKRLHTFRLRQTSQEKALFFATELRFSLGLDIPSVTRDQFTY